MYNIIKSLSLKKKKTFSSNYATIQCFFLQMVAFKTHLIPNWKIQMEWKNDE